MPSDEVETYTPGDLYDVLSTMPEVRFHAGHLFLRYFHVVDPSSPASGDSASDEDIDLIALQMEELKTCSWSTTKANIVPEIHQAST